MLSIVTLALCVLQLYIAHGNAAVQTPYGLVDQTLQVAFDNTLINPPGLTIPLSVPVAVPKIGLTSSPTKDNYLIILVDPDSSKPDVLHWFQTNFTLSSSNITVASLSFHPLLSTTPPLASYVKPNPPAGSGPHRYTELLYSQPANFSIPAKYASFFGADSNRTAFNLSSFVKDAGLGKPVAANYFLAENSTAQANQTTGTRTSSTSATGTAGARTGSTSVTGAAGTRTSSTSATGTGRTAQATGTTSAKPFTGDANSINIFELSGTTILLVALSMFVF